MLTFKQFLQEELITEDLGNLKQVDKFFSDIIKTGNKLDGYLGNNSKIEKLTALTNISDIFELINKIRLSL